jgi:hypothetical protein
VRLNQATQHSQSTASLLLPTNRSEDEDDAPAEDAKMSPVELNGRKMTFDKILDTFMSTETSDQLTWLEQHLPNLGRCQRDRIGTR